MKKLIMILLLLGSYPTYAETTIVRFFVNGEESTPVVSITETPHSVKVSIKNNETGEVIEGEVSTEDTITGGEKPEPTEEEPNCE